MAAAAIAARLLARALARACANGLTARLASPRGRCMLIRWQRRRRRCAPPRRAQSAAFEAPVFGGSARPARPGAPTLTQPAPRPQAKAAAGEEDAGAAYAPWLVAHATCGPLSHVRRSSSLPAATRRREAPEEDAGPVTLPLARVKRIIRLDPDVKQTQLDAVRLISRATVRARRGEDMGISARAACVRRSRRSSVAQPQALRERS